MYCGINDSCNIGYVFFSCAIQRPSFIITIQRDPAHSYEAQSFLKFLRNEQHIFNTQNQRAIGDESKTR